MNGGQHAENPDFTAAEQAAAVRALDRIARRTDRATEAAAPATAPGAIRRASAWLMRKLYGARSDG